MNAAVMQRDALMPRQPRGLGIGLLLALLAHALLVLMLAYGVRWRASQPQGLEAELWSAVPQAAAPRTVTPEPPVAEVKPSPSPPRRPEPVAPPEPRPQAAPDPQIAIEQAKREAARREEAERRQQARLERAERDQEKLAEQKREEAEQAKLEARQVQERKKKEAERLQAERLQAERLQAERLQAERLQAEKLQAEKLQAEKERVADATAREANLKRMQGLAGATGSAARSSGPSAGYAGRIRARIKPNIVFSDPVGGNLLATVEVRLAPDGSIIGKRLVKGSGLKSWDDAVLRAIEKTAVLPTDIDGRVPASFEIDFKPLE